MMKVFRGIFLVLMCWCGTYRCGYAQTWEIGAFGGSAGYMGDLNPVSPFKIHNLALGAFAKRNFDGYWSLKLSLMHGKIEAADSLSDNEQYKQRNLSFFTPLTEIGLQTEFNLFNYIPAVSRRKYSPYLFAGVALALFNPKTIYNGETYELNPLSTENQNLNNPYKRYTISIPYGAGIKYNVLQNWTLGAEIGYRTTFTDYLDDVSGRYPDFSGLNEADPFNALRIALADRSPEKGYAANAPFSQRGDFRQQDTYFFTGFTLSYTFPNRKCPPVQ